MLPDKRMLIDWLPGLPQDLPPLASNAPEYNPLYIALKAPFVITTISGIAKLIFSSPLFGTLFIGASTYFAARFVKKILGSSIIMRFLEKKAIFHIHAFPNIYLISFAVILATSPIFSLFAHLLIAITAAHVALTIDRTQYAYFFAIEEALDL